ncbi:uncharacterized protein G2W53_015557 [Senna tora]|uniref:Uncharacterized protein n=1 Tax=Senna tora TaxID=362788 RepID=A0A834WVV2_9FABA|nr:uncharacterized protein G2W53_015557 [Senna tora]
MLVASRLSCFLNNAAFMQIGRKHHGAIGVPVFLKWDEHSSVVDMVLLSMLSGLDLIWIGGIVVRDKVLIPLEKWTQFLSKILDFHDLAQFMHACNYIQQDQEEILKTRQQDQKALNLKEIKKMVFLAKIST